MKKITEQELYYQTKRLRREKRISNLVNFFTGLITLVGVMCGLAVVIILLCGIFGGLRFIDKEDKLATRDELGELNIRVQLLEYRSTPLTIWTNGSTVTNKESVIFDFHN